jgi:hypothetical protein
MNDVDMGHMEFLEDVAIEDCASLREKEATYQGSWKRRGGVGAFMMMARKWDRLEVMVKNQTFQYDIFRAIDVAPEKQGQDGTALAEIRDLRRYLILVEAEMMSRVLFNKDGTPHEKTAAVAATHEELRRAGAHVPLDGDAQIKTIDPRFSRVIVGDMIREQGRSPRPAWGVGVDGEKIRIGDSCTCMPQGQSAFDTTLLDIRYDEQPIVDQGGAQFLTSWKHLRKQPVTDKKRTVPRMFEQAPFALGHEPKDDESVHSSLVPHVVQSGYFAQKNIGVTMRERFWCHRAAGTHVLEPHVVSDALPRELHGFYDMQNDNGEVSWLLKIERAPTDARDMFPRLRREKNSVELDGLPAWQRGMYAWRESENKHVLADRYLPWTGEET